MLKFGRISHEKKLDDEIFQKVRDQYEAHPYPRWVNWGLAPKPATISEVLEQRDLKVVDHAATKI